jgi:hypothetical protein
MMKGKTKSSSGSSKSSGKVYFKYDNVEFEFDKTTPEYQKALTLADEYAKELYEDEYEFYVDEMADLVVKGLVESREEYKRIYGAMPETYEEAAPNYADRRDKKAAEYLKNYYDIPQRILISVDAQTAEQPPELLAEYIKERVSDEYKMPVKSLGEKATIRFAEYSKKLSYDAVRSMTESKDFQKFLEMQGHLSRYSYSNITAIFYQNKDATIVYGKKSWEDLGREVKDFWRAKKLWISAPNMRLLKTEESINKFFDKWNADTPNKRREIEEKRALAIKELKENGKPYQTIEGYKPSYVFDISSTVSKDPEHDNLDKILRDSEPVTFEKNSKVIIKALNETFVALDRKDIRLGKDADAETVYNSLMDYADRLLSTNPESILGIRSREVLKKEEHKIEVLFAVNGICSQLGVDCKEKIAVALSKAFTKVQSDMVKSRMEVFETTYNRGHQLAAQFMKSYEPKKERIEKKEKDDKEL